MGSDYLTKTRTTLTQEDKSISAAGDAENIIGAGGKQIGTGSGSLIVDAPNTRLGDIVFNQFPEAVQETIGSLIKSVDTTTKTVGQALSQQQLGGEANLPKIIMYVMVGGGIIFVASRIFKR